MHISLFDLTAAAIARQAADAACDWYGADEDAAKVIQHNAIADLVEELALDTKTALALLLACGVLPPAEHISRITPGLTPGYQAGVRKAAEVCLIQSALAKLRGEG